MTNHESGEVIDSVEESENAQIEKDVIRMNHGLFQPEREHVDDASAADQRQRTYVLHLKISFLIFISSRLWRMY